MIKHSKSENDLQKAKAIIKKFPRLSLSKTVNLLYFSAP